MDGEGFVWLHDPLTASGQPYGGAYSDNGDADNATLTGLLQSVTLQDIEQGSDGSYRLNGPWVKIVGSSAPTETDPRNFKYTRGDNRFEAVMVYYYIDQSQRYVESLDVGHPLPQSPVSADPQAFPDDNSYYQPGNNALFFGTGGVDDGEDVGVILHEYGHVLMYNHAESVRNLNDEQAALSEGFADYWAVSYRRSLMESGLVPQGDWREVFPWDGIAWGGRRADGNHSYQEIQNACRESCDFYEYGTTWTALMMELWEEIGRENTDRLHLAAFSYIGPNFTLRDMAEALLQADDALYSDQYNSEILNVFIPKGFVESTIGVPLISHTPPQYILDLTRPVRFEADIDVEEYSITAASVNYRLDFGDFQTLPLTLDSGTQWSAEILFPESSTLLEYYLQASTEVASVTLPRSAPQMVWSVQLGEDTQAPTITHTPVTHVTAQEALLPYRAQVTDNFSVSRVELEYTITNSLDQSTVHSSLSLLDEGNDMYSFYLPLPTIPQNRPQAHWLEYRIVAYDEATPPNIKTFPSSDQPSVRVDVLAAANELGIWNPGDGIGLSSGEWGIDNADFGHQGDFWITAPGGPYSNQPSLSLLSFPDVNVAGYPNAHLEFWHWYDFENTHVPGPGDVGGIIFDGGQIQFSTDGGQSWTVATPQWGYNGEVEAALSNPLASTPAFGGSSLGWRRVRVPFPNAPAYAYRYEVSSRLVFGTGSGNSNSTTDDYAGWAIRDVRALIDPPIDLTPPAIHQPPYSHQFIPASDTTFSIQISATDHPGIESIRLHLFDLNQSQSLTKLGEFRLQPYATDQNWFYADIPVPFKEPGSNLGYYLTVRDFDNNLLRIGENSPSSLLNLYVPSVPPRPASISAHSSGVWTKIDDGYSTRKETNEQQSSIVLVPTYFSTVSDRTMLRLRHHYDLPEGDLGRISFTENSGINWTPLPREYGLTNTASIDPYEFTGSVPGIIESWYDLSTLRQPYQLRIDLIHGSQNTDPGFWDILSAEYYRLTEETAVIPNDNDMVLYPNFPNPFKDQTTLNYVLPEPLHVQIMIFNLLGQNIQTVVDRQLEAGGYGMNLDLRGLAPGVYWVRMEAGNTLLQQPITLVR